jgi:hypothetical protein
VNGSSVSPAGRFAARNPAEHPRRQRTSIGIGTRYSAAHHASPRDPEEYRLTPHRPPGLYEEPVTCRFEAALEEVRGEGWREQIADFIAFLRTDGFEITLRVAISPRRRHRYRAAAVPGPTILTIS